VRLPWVAFSVLLMAACGSGGPPEPGSSAQLVAAAGRGEPDEVQRLLGEGVPVDARDFRGVTAVTAAAMGRHAAVVRLLVDAGADVDLQDGDRNNPLLVCGETGDVAVLREVLRGEPDLGATNRYGGTALIPASDRGHVEMVRALLETDIDVDHVNRLGWTALLEAVILGDGGPDHQRIVERLVDAGADRAITDEDGVTALEHARDRGYTEIVGLLERR
jgi:ankyrin repeat protein